MVGGSIVTERLLEIKHLQTHFSTERGPVTAVDGISFIVEAGETLGVVGESGSGKSVTSESILRLLDEKRVAKYNGEILFKGKNILTMSDREMRDIRGNEISMIFQDPMSSLNPVYTVGNQIAESIMLHQKKSKKEAYEIAIQMLALTGIPSPEKRVHEYPHELSGGMRQRVMIALALSCQPSLLIADEPTTALDVTTQAQILDVMQNLKDELNMGIIFITHDLGVVAEICTRVVVMYLGQIVEEASVKTLFQDPLHPYTKGLMKSIPHIDGDKTEKLHVIKGTVPTLHNIPKGCRYAPRCEFAMDICHQREPEVLSYENGHRVKCWLYDETVKNEEVMRNVEA